MSNPHPHDVHESQIVYARWLKFGSRLSLGLLAASFLVYLAGFIAPAVPVADLPRYWGLSVREYLAATGSPKGWDWLGLVGKSDFMNFVGIACIAFVTPICYLRVLPAFVMRRDKVFAVAIVLELLVLGLAASGVLSG